ncbi:MAG: YqjK-like family protein [Gallionella sp.]|nr:YqjK-like family protein [Gallionella sp.]
MNEKLFELKQRRVELLARIASQREQVAEAGAEWEAPLALADKGISGVHYLRRHPLLVVGAMAFILIRRGRAAGLMWGAWRLWKGYRYLSSIPEKMPSRAELDSL